jgi:hypothetical protein
MPEFGIRASSSNVMTTRPGAATYFKQALKFPVWTFPDEDDISDSYLGALFKVCEHVKAGGEI